MRNLDLVSNFFLSKKSMSQKKLQKLLYYAYSWTLALLNERADDLHFKLFGETFEAWTHGPVIPYIYNKYKSYGWDDIPQISDFNTNVFSEDVLDVLNQVWQEYGTLTGNQLESLTHKEEPWQKARLGLPVAAPSNNLISDTDIFNYYNQRLS